MQPVLFDQNNAWVPPSLIEKNVALKPYQKENIHWMLDIEPNFIQ